MKASFVEKSPLVVKFMAFYNWWGMNVVVPDVVIHSTKSSLEFGDFL